MKWQEYNYEIVQFSVPWTMDQGKEEVSLNDNLYNTLKSVGFILKDIVRY